MNTSPTESETPENSNIRAAIHYRAQAALPDVEAVRERAERRIRHEGSWQRWRIPLAAAVAVVCAIAVTLVLTNEVPERHIAGSGSVNTDIQPGDLAGSWQVTQYSVEEVPLDLPPEEKILVTFGQPTFSITDGCGTSTASTWTITGNTLTYDTLINSGVACVDDGGPIEPPEQYGALLTGLESGQLVVEYEPDQLQITLKSSALSLTAVKVDDVDHSVVVTETSAEQESDQGTTGTTISTTDGQRTISAIITTTG